MHLSHFLHNSSSSHLHAAEHLELTWHLWYAEGTAAAAVAPFSESFDLNEVVFTSGDLKLHTGFIGLQHRSHAVPGLMIHNLEGQVAKHVVCWKYCRQSVECVRNGVSVQRFIFFRCVKEFKVFEAAGVARQHSQEAFTNRIVSIFFTHWFSLAFQCERNVIQCSHWLKGAKFLQCRDSVHFINRNRSFNFGRPDRASP